MGTYHGLRSGSTAAGRGTVRRFLRSMRQTSETRQSALPPKADMCGAASDVRFGSKADIRTANSHVALPPRADICGAKRNVRYGPEADIATHSIGCASPNRGYRQPFRSPSESEHTGHFEAAWNKSCCCDASGAPCFARHIVAK